MFRKLLAIYNETPLPMIINYPKYAQIQYIKKLASISRGARVLDAGAGECPYKKYFTNSEYVSQDICYDEIENFNFDEVDIRSEIYNIPVKNNSFDYILCTDVLEHLKYPAKAFSEFFRILKPSGELWLSVPFSGAEHMIPFDYYRFSRYALKFLGEDAGFKVKEITPLGGRFAYFGIALKTLIPNMFEDNLMLYRLLAFIQLPFIIIPLLLCFILDKTDKEKKLPPCFFSIYKKP